MYVEGVLSGDSESDVIEKALRSFCDGLHEDYETRDDLISALMNEMGFSVKEIEEKQSTQMDLFEDKNDDQD